MEQPAQSVVGEVSESEGVAAQCFQTADDRFGGVLPLLYLHGLSSGDFVAALGQFLGSTKGLSSTITKMTETWQAEQKAFAKRDLSGVDYVYTWADGIHVNVRLGR